MESSPVCGICCHSPEGQTEATDLNGGRQCEDRDRRPQTPNKGEQVEVRGDRGKRWIPSREGPVLVWWLCDDKNSLSKVDTFFTSLGKKYYIRQCNKKRCLIGHRCNLEIDYLDLKY